MAIRGILFDKDGTLVDFDATWSAIAQRLALEAAGGARETADRLLDRAGYDVAQDCFRADSAFAAGTNADIVALWYPDRTPQERQRMIAHFDEVTATEGARCAVAVSGIPHAIARLHGDGYRLGVATNDSTSGAEKTIAALGIAQMFVAAYGYDAVAAPKPAPDTVFAFCDLTGLKPSEIAMVGDNGHDLEMAHAAGAGLAIGVLSGTGTRETLARRASVVLGSVAELPDWLAGR